MYITINYMVQSNTKLNSKWHFTSCNLQVLMRTCTNFWDFNGHWFLYTELSSVNILFSAIIGIWIYHVNRMYMPSVCTSLISLIVVKILVLNLARTGQSVLESYKELNSSFVEISHHNNKMVFASSFQANLCPSLSEMRGLCLMKRPADWFSKKNLYSLSFQLLILEERTGLLFFDFFLLFY